MKNKFIVYPFATIVAVITFLFSLMISVVLFTNKRPVSGAGFLVIAAIFFIVAAVYGSTIRINESGLVKTTLFFIKKEYSWQGIREVGVLGTKVFNKSNTSRTGALFIYFSEKELSDDDRFEMGLKWPPKNRPYLVYDKVRLHTVQTYWSGEVQHYNTGKITFV